MRGSQGRGPAVLIALALALVIVTGLALYFLLPRGGGGPEGPEGLLTPAGEKGRASSVADSGKDGGRAEEPAGDPGDLAAEGKTVAPAAQEPGPPSLQGTVRNAAGDGVPGAGVIALNADDWDEVMRDNQAKLNSSNDPREAFQLLSDAYRRRIEGIARTRSGPDGAYRFHDLKPGNYRLLVTHEEYLPLTDAWAEVAPGESSTVDVELVQAYSISGAIVDEKGQAVGGARVQAIPSSEGQKRGFGRFIGRFVEMMEGDIVLEGDPPASAADGGFRVSSLQPVPYDLRVAKPGYAEAEAQHVPAGAQGVVIVLPKGKSISARVVDPAVRPVEGAEWEVRPALPKNLFENPLAMMQEDFDLTGEKTLRGKTGKDGRLEIAGRKSGAYDLDVRAAGYPAERYRINIGGEGEDLGDLTLQSPLEISGKVVGPDGKPVEGARVWIPRPLSEGDPLSRRTGVQSALLAEARADPSGKYVLELLPKGSFQVHASTEDFPEASLEGVEAGSRNVDIKLSRGITLEGKVLDQESKEPVTKARITLMTMGNRTAVTDAEGLFSIRGIAPGGQGPGGNQPQAAGPQPQAFLQVSHPDYDSEFRPISLAREPGAPPEEFLLTRKKSILGVVVDPEGNPVQHARVRLEVPGVPEIALMLGPGGGERKVFSARDGSFEVDVPARGMGDMGSKMELVASHPAHSSGRIPIEELKLEDGTYAQAEIVLPPGVAISGKVTDEGGRPLAGAQVGLQRSTAGIGAEVLLMAAMMPGKVGKTVYAGADGNYRVGGVEPGKYSLEVQAAGFARKRIDIAVADRPVEQDVVLDAGGTIGGVVKDGEGRPIAGIEVVAFLDVEQPEARRIEEFALIMAMAGSGSSQARTGEDGGYLLTHLPEGKYTVAARGKGLVPASASGMKPGDRAPDLIVQRLGSLRVKVVAPGGAQPVTSYTIQMQRIAGEGSRFDAYIPAEGVEASNGEYLRESLSPGAYQVNVKSAGYSEVSVKAQVLEGRENAISIPLEQGFRVEVLVIEAQSRQPIEGATVTCQRLRMEGEEDPEWFRQRLELRTDGNGLASTDTLSAGRYQVDASHTFYFPALKPSPDIEFPRDSGSRVEFPMSPAGKIKGRLAGIPPSDHDSASYLLVLRPAEPAEGGKDAEKAKTPGRQKGDSSGQAEERSVWVNVQDGSFEEGGIRPGKYAVLLRVTRYRKVEDGRLEQVQGPQDPVEIGTAEVRAGETEDLELRAP